MKKLVLIGIVLIITVSVQAGIIWDFESPATTPTSITMMQGFYVYTSSTVAGQGIGGSNALRITVDARTRPWGGGFALTSGTPLNLSATPWFYFSIKSDAVSPFGVAVEVKDTTGSLFTPPPGPYTAYAQQFAGTIGATFQQATTFNLSAFDKYPGSGAPDLNVVKTFNFIFPDNTASATGPLHFFLDNVGSSSVQLPVELSSFEATAK